MSMLLKGAGVPDFFDPAALPGYIASPFSFAALRAGGRLWQDGAKTTPAVANGDPVRVAVCGGTDWTAPSDAARPLLYDEGGGKWSLSFDGVDDFLLGGDLSAHFSTAATVGIRVNVTSESFATDWVMFSTSLNDVYDRYGGAGYPGQLRIARLNGVAPWPVGDHTMTIRSDGSLWERRADGAADVTGVPDFGGVNNWQLGGYDYVAAGRNVACRVRGFAVVSVTLTGSDLTALESYLGAL